MSNNPLGEDWFDGFREAIAANDGAAVCTVEMIPAEGFDDLMEAAEGGDEDARKSVVAFANWSRSIDQAAKQNVRPACFQCGQGVTKIEDGGDGIGGIAIIYPTAKTDEATEGAVAVFCPACKHLGPWALMPKLREAMQDEMGVDTFEIQ
jgi:ABC-type branched-subunit amino acid transport system substrate-binding protein